MRRQLGELRPGAARMIARKQIYDQHEVGVYHCFSRCVRRAFLCGKDEYTGKDYSHRKQWLEELLELAATYYVVDVLAFGILDNHFHVMLRQRPDLRKKLSATAVARRWLMLHPKRRDAKGNACEPTWDEIREITKDGKRVKELRNRLANISWFVGFVKEKLARRANKEDDVTGAFFEKRFEMKRLLTENAVLACSIYIDLNPIRAGLALTPETSEQTSAWRRIQATLARREGRVAKEAMTDRWLAPIYDRSLPKNQQFATKGWRASDKAALGMQLEQYLELLDWCGRQVRLGKTGKIPNHLAPILDRLGIQREHWLDLVQSFGQLFRRIAGDAEAIEQHAAIHRRKWYHGLAHCRQMFVANDTH